MLIKWGRSNDFPPKLGGVYAIDHFWGECSSKVIFFGGVEIKLVDLVGVWSPGAAPAKIEGGLMVVSGTRPPLKNENSSDLGLFKLKMSKMRRKK